MQENHILTERDVTHNATLFYLALAFDQDVFAPLSVRMLSLGSSAIQENSSLPERGVKKSCSRAARSKSKSQF